MALPTFANYVILLRTSFDRFVQSQSARVHRGHPFVYQHQRLLVFFAQILAVCSAYITDGVSLCKTM